MGKISVAGNSKKERDDVVGLVTPRKDKKVFKDKDVETQQDSNQPPSPTPKRPLNKAKSGCCCRVCLFTLGVFVVLIIFGALATLLDYQQGHGHLADHTARMSKELKGKSDYIVEVFYQTPKNLDRLLNGIWSEGNDTAVQRESKLFKNDSESKNGRNPEYAKEGNNDEDAVVGFQGVGQFFAGILYDVGSIFVAEFNDTERVNETEQGQEDQFQIDDDTGVVESKELEQNDDILSEAFIRNAHGDVFESTTEKEFDIEEAAEESDEMYPDEYTIKPGSRPSKKEEFIGASRNKHVH